VFLFAISDLHGFVTIDIIRLELSHHAGTHFNNGTREILSVTVEDAGHSDFFAN
jgi:hypothetical protein